MPFERQSVVGVYSGPGFSVEESIEAVHRRMAQGVRAWICAADHQAYDLIAGLQKRGVQVPRDVSITGFDGIEKPDWAPLLTTAVIPYREIGFTGGRRLLDLMRKRFGSTQHILVASRLREGETVAECGSVPKPTP
jgi:DNA-binding LacI/PurR family transcriptional regulator